MNPEPFFQLDKVIHEKGRMAIVSLLAASPGLSFTELRDALGMTDGNLMAHIRALREAGYVAVTKAPQLKRPPTRHALTEEGDRAFRNYLDLLERIVRENKARDGS